MSNYPTLHPDTIRRQGLKKLEHQVRLLESGICRDDSAFAKGTIYFIDYWIQILAIYKKRDEFTKIEYKRYKLLKERANEAKVNYIRH